MRRHSADFVHVVGADRVGGRAQHPSREQTNTKRQLKQQKQQKQKDKGKNSQRQQEQVRKTHIIKRMLTLAVDVEGATPKRF